jgi:hypothetical protein
MLRPLSRLVAVALPFLTLASSGATGFQDGFDASPLDPTKWMVIKGSPSVSGGFLHLPGGSTRAEVQSLPTFLYGDFQIVIESADWHPYALASDSSFGLEFFSPQNCHYRAPAASMRNFTLRTMFQAVLP